MKVLVRNVLGRRAHSLGRATAGTRISVKDRISAENAMEELLGRVELEGVARGVGIKRRCCLAGNLLPETAPEI